MPEILTPLEPEKFYHIYNHAIAKDNFFESDADYHWFLQGLKKYVVPVCDVYAFCLMPNHFHLVIKIKCESEIVVILNDKSTGKTSLKEKMQSNEGYLAKALSQQIGNLFNAYAKYFNYTHKRNGTLFTRAFRRKWVESEDYLKQLVCYVHQNPVKAGFALRAEQWKYSSYNAIIGKTQTLVMRNQVIECFDGIENFVFCNNMFVDLDLG